MNESPRISANASDAGETTPKLRRRGRPAEMTRDEILEGIRQLARRKTGLFQVHLTQGSLYARARRYFGSWSAAVAAAGLDYSAAMSSARARSLKTRRRRSNAARTRRSELSN